MKKVIFKYKKPLDNNFVLKCHHFILYCENKPKIFWKQYFKKLVKQGCYDIEVTDYEDFSIKYYLVKNGMLHQNYKDYGRIWSTEYEFR